MKLERTKNASRNILFGVILQIYNLLVPFLLRTALVYCLGVEYLGLSSLFTSVLSVLNMAELGVGSAMVFSMYKPIAEDDTQKICALMNLYKKYYRIIGLTILVIGILITPGIPHIVKGHIPEELNIYVLYYINLFATVLTYWLFAYKNCLLAAHQRNDVTSKVTLITRTIMYAIQFYILFIVRDYYFYILITLVMQVFQNIITAIIVSKMYPQYSAKGNVDKQEVKVINQKVKDLFTARIGGTITNSADTIVISSFLGLAILAMYQNYFYIITAIIGFANVAYTACIAGIGNSIVTETKEKNYKDFETILFIVCWCISICTCCLLNLFQPFMEIWMGNELMFKFSAVICFCLYFVIYEINAVLNLFKDAAGIWHKDRFRPLVVSLVNLALNLATVKIWGIYGVLLSTVLSMGIIGIPWIVNNLFSTIYEKYHKKDFVVKMIKYIIYMCIICVVSYALCTLITLDGILALIIKGIICFGVSNVLFIIVNFKTKEAKNTKVLIKNILKRK